MRALASLDEADAAVHGCASAGLSCIQAGCAANTYTFKDKERSTDMKKGIFRRVISLIIATCMVFSRQRKEPVYSRMLPKAAPMRDTSILLMQTD